MVDVTITLTDEQSAAITEHGIDAQAVCIAALGSAVERAALAEAEEQANQARRQVVEQVAATFPPPELEPVDSEVNDGI